MVLHIHSRPLNSFILLCLLSTLIGWTVSEYRNCVLSSSCSDPASPHIALFSLSSLILFLLPTVSSFLLLLVCSPTHSSSAGVSLGAHASFQTCSSHSASTTILVNLHLLYMPFLFNTEPLIWILTASRTCRSSALLHFLTTLKLNRGVVCSPLCAIAWCSSMWLSSCPVSASLQCSSALSWMERAVSPTYRLAISPFSPSPSLSAAFLAPGGLHLAHSLS